ncbi:MAG: PKD domain-containing protein [Bacteroidota bacterium]
MGASFDPDGDSLTYAFAPALQAYNSPVTYFSPFSHSTPLPWSGASTSDFPGGIRCDTFTGRVLFTPSNASPTTFYGVLCIEAKQWKKISGVPTIIGRTTRDIQVAILGNCAPNNDPSLQTDPPNVVNPNFPKDDWVFPSGIQTCFTMLTKDPDYLPPILSDTTLIDTLNSFPLLGGVFTRLVPIGTIREDSIKFCWTPTSAQESNNPYLLSVAVRDKRTPIPGSNHYVLKIKVPQNPQITAAGIKDSAKACNLWDFSYIVQPGSPAVVQTRWNIYKLSAGIPSIVYTVTAPGTFQLMNKMLADSGKYVIGLDLFQNLTTGSFRSYTDTINVLQNEIKITGTDTLVCPGTGVLLSSTISHGVAPYSILWTNGTATGTAATYSLTSGKVDKWVTLKVTDSRSCSYTDTAWVKAKATPQLQIGLAGDSIQCEKGNFFTFINQTNKLTIPGCVYSWLLNDSVTYSGDTLSLSLPPSGIQSMKLIVTTPEGCHDTLIRKVWLRASPRMAFTVNDTTQCLGGNAFTFTNQTTMTSGTATYQWQTITASAATPNFSFGYPYSGIFTVKLKATNSTYAACKDSVVRNVYVYAQPMVTFSVNSSIQCSKGNSFVLTNNTVADSSLQFKWFLNGDTLSGSPVTYAFPTIGSNPVKLRMYSAFGCNDSSTQTFTVQASPTAALILADSTQCKNSSFVFTNNSAISAGFMNYNWNMGNGQVYSSLNVNYIYPSPGIYSVRLIANNTSAVQCRDTVYQKVYVYPKPTVTNTINNTSQCVKNNAFTFTNTTPSDSSLQFTWLAGTDSATGTIFSRSFTISGTQTVKLRMSSIFGCNDSLSKTVTVHESPLATYLASDTIACQKNTFTFTNQSSIAAPHTLSYNWNMGNGITFTTANAMYTYPSAGSYTVRLIATSQTATICKDTMLKQVTVLAQPPVSGTVNSTAQCLTNNQFVYNNTSSGQSDPNNTFVWKSDSGLFTGPVLTRQYTTSGTKTVKLLLSTTNGCKDSAVFPVTVLALPVASYQVNDSVQCLRGNTFVFNNTSQSANSILFTIDGINASTNAVTRSFATTGVKIVRLIATTGLGCIDTLNSKVEVWYSPKVTVSISDTVVCRHENILFKDSSVNSLPVWGVWGFADGLKDTARTVTRAFVTAGNQLIYRVIATAQGCLDSITKIIKVVGPATPVITGPLTASPNTPVIYNVPPTIATTYFWSIEHGKILSSKTDTPSVAVSWDSTSANGRVYLSLKDSSGCYGDTARLDIVIIGGVGLTDVHASFQNLAVFPNPTTDAITLSLNSIQAQHIRVKLFNIVGSEIRTISYNAPKGMLNEYISLHDLQKGIYFMRIEGETGNQTVKILLK